MPRSKRGEKSRFEGIHVAWEKPLSNETKLIEKCQNHRILYLINGKCSCYENCYSHLLFVTISKTQLEPFSNNLRL